MRGKTWGRDARQANADCLSLAWVVSKAQSAGVRQDVSGGPIAAGQAR